MKCTQATGSADSHSPSSMKVKDDAMHSSRMVISSAEILLEALKSIRLNT